MLILGDVHGKFDEVHRIIRNTTHEVICVGDLGIGLPKCPTNDQFGPDKRLYRKEEWGMTTPEFKVGEKAIAAVEIGGWLRQ